MARQPLLSGSLILGDSCSQSVAQFGLFEEYKPCFNSELLIGVLDGINHNMKGWGVFLSPDYTNNLVDETSNTISCTYDAIQ